MSGLKNQAGEPAALAATSALLRCGDSPPLAPEDTENTTKVVLG